MWIRSGPGPDVSLPQVDGSTKGHQIAGLRPPNLGAEPSQRRQDQSDSHAEIKGPTGLHLLLDTATGVEVSPRRLQSEEKSGNGLLSP